MTVATDRKNQPTWDELTHRAKELSQETLIVRQQLAQILPQKLMEFVAETPGLTSIGWKQYTPYFNDGDACEFSTSIEYPRINGFCFDSHEWVDDEAAEQHSNFTVEEIYRLLDPLRATVKEFLGQVEDCVLETAFGERSVVTITATTYSKEKYESAY